METEKAAWNRALTADSGASAHRATRGPHTNAWQAEAPESVPSVAKGANASAANVWLRPMHSIERPTMTPPPKMAQAAERPVATADAPSVKAQAAVLSAPRALEAWQAPAIAERAPEDAPRRRRTQRASEAADVIGVNYASTYSVTAAAVKEPERRSALEAADAKAEPDQRDDELLRAPEAELEDDEDDGEEAYPHTPEPVPVPTFDAAIKPRTRQKGNWRLVVGTLFAIALLGALATLYFIGAL